MEYKQFNHFLIVERARNERHFFQITECSLSTLGESLFNSRREHAHRSGVPSKTWTVCHTVFDKMPQRQNGQVVLIAISEGDITRPFEFSDCIGPDGWTIGCVRRQFSNGEWDNHAKGRAALLFLGSNDAELYVRKEDYTPELARMAMESLAIVD